MEWKEVKYLLRLILVGFWELIKMSWRGEFDFIGKESQDFKKRI